MKTILLISFIFAFLYSTGQTPGTVMQTTKISSIIGGMPSNSIQVGSHFGCSIDTIGDLNNDGVIDLVVGAYQDDDGGAGRGAAYVLFMDTNRTVSSYKKISATTLSFSNNNIANNDGFGYRVAGIGDINNDGNPDIAVGAIFSDIGGTDKGNVYIIMLNSDGTVQSHTNINEYSTGVSLATDGWFACVAGIGDIDNDGVFDLAVGNAKDNTGAVWIFRLNNNGTIKSSYKITNNTTNFSSNLNNNDRFGCSVNSISDINDDGINDIVVGAFYDDDGGYNSGAIYVIKLDTNGTVKSYSKISNNSVTGSPFNGQFGVSVCAIPDLDGNGIDNLLIGAYAQNSYTGGFYTINISNSGFLISYLAHSGSIGNNASGDRLGWGISPLLNINSNGYTEVCIGAARDDDGNTDNGAVYVVSLATNLSVSCNIISPLCHNDSSGIAIAVGIGSNPPYTYLWNNGNTNDTINNLTAGTYSVTVTNSLNINSNTSITINNPPLLSITSSDDSTLCNNDSIQLSCFASGGIGTKTIYWNNNLSSSNTHIVSPNSTITYSVYAKDNNLCISDTDNITITVNPLPIVNFTGLYPTYCNNDNPSVLVGSPSGGVFSGSGISGNTFYPNLVTNSLPHKVYYSYTDANGCIGNDSSLYNFFLAVSIQITGIDSTYCTNSPDLNLYSLPLTNCDYYINNVFSSVFSPSTLGAGTYNIEVSYTDFGNGCVSTDSFISIVNNSPISNLSGLNNSYCSNEETDTLIGTPFGGIYIGSGVVDSIFNPSSAGFGSHIINYIITSTENDCTDTSSISTTVYQIPTIDAGNDTIVPCNSTGIIIGENFEAMHTYLWQPYAGLDNPFSSSPTANPWLNTVFTVQKTSLISQCSSMDTIEVNIPDSNPEIEITGDTILCFGDSLHLTANSNSSGNISWNNGVNSNNLDEYITNTQYIGAIITDSNSCIGEDSVFIIINPLPTPFIGNDTTLSQSQSLVLDAGNYNSYLWNNGDISQSITVDGNNLGIGNVDYFVFVTDTNSCTGGDTITISIINNIENTINNSTIKVYPNPTNGVVNIEWDEKKRINTITIFDSYGKQVKNIKISSFSITKTIDISTLNKGIYYLQLIGDNSFNFKVIVE